MRVLCKYERARIEYQQKMLLPEGFEPTTPDSKSGVLTTTLWEHIFDTENDDI